MGSVKRITVHHEGAPIARWATGRAQTAEILRGVHRYHTQERGWADIGYHFVVDRGGRVWEGRPAALQGAHVRDRNPNNLGVMVLGNFDRQQPSDAQLMGLARLVRALRRKHGVAEREIRSHQEWLVTSCPGRHLQPRFASMRSNRLFA
jgi:hypothetical protein